MSILRRILSWAVPLTLVALGWFAMVPIWTRGLGLAALDADNQPALWLAAANVMVVLGGGAILFRTVAAFSGEGRLGSIMRKAQVLGLGMYLTALVLYLAMCGQPLRVWFLVAQWDWGNPLCRGILGFVVCLLTLFFGSNRGILKFVIVFSGLGAFILLISQVSPSLPVVHGRLVAPTPQDWLVLAFALGCGTCASWLRARGLSKSTEEAAR